MPAPCGTLEPGAVDAVDAVDAVKMLLKKKLTMQAGCALALYLTPETVNAPLTKFRQEKRAATLRKAAQTNQSTRQNALMLSPEVQKSAARSVLCWLATVDAMGQPSVSPKEIFAVFDSAHLVIANIASPTSVRNIKVNPRVCVSFIDVFVQKGFKVLGTARNVSRTEPEFSTWSAPLEAKAGPRFPIHGVLVIKAVEIEPIVAPSYRLYAADTTEEAQVASAMRTYGVRPMPGDA